MFYRKSVILLLTLSLTFLATMPFISLAQGGLQQQQLDLPRDPALEKEAKHNLDVAKFYLKRKAYKAVTDRLLEIVYTYPKFSHLDEVLSILADCFVKIDNKTEGAKFYQQLVKDFPDSDYAKDAKKRLESLPSVSEN